MRVSSPPGSIGATQHAHEALQKGECLIPPLPPICLYGSPALSCLDSRPHVDDCCPSRQQQAKGKLHVVVPQMEGAQPVCTGVGVFPTDIAPHSTGCAGTPDALIKARPYGATARLDLLMPNTQRCPVLRYLASPYTRCWFAPPPILAARPTLASRDADFRRYARTAGASECNAMERAQANRNLGSLRVKFVRPQASTGELVAPERQMFGQRAQGVTARLLRHVAVIVGDGIDGCISPRTGIGLRPLHRTLAQRNQQRRAWPSSHGMACSREHHYRQRRRSTYRATTGRAGRQARWCSRRLSEALYRGDLPGRCVRAKKDLASSAALGATVLVCPRRQREQARGERHRCISSGGRPYLVLRLVLDAIRALGLALLVRALRIFSAKSSLDRLPTCWQCDHHTVARKRQLPLLAPISATTPTNRGFSL